MFEGIYIKKSLGNIGWVQIVLTIASVVVSLVKAGYPYYEALQEAKRQQKEQRLFSAQENVQLAEALVSQFPNITYDQWLRLVELTNIIYPPRPIAPPPDSGWTKYIPYAIIVGFLLMAGKK